MWGVDPTCIYICTYYMMFIIDLQFFDGFRKNTHASTDIEKHVLFFRRPAEGPDVTEPTETWVLDLHWGACDQQI